MLTLSVAQVQRETGNIAEAKNELANVVTPTADKIEGWSKCVNNRGAPIDRRENDECSKRQLHVENVIVMFQVIYNAKFAIVRRSRLQPNTACAVPVD